MDKDHRNNKPMEIVMNITLVLSTIFLTFCISEYIVRQLPISDRLGWTRLPSIQQRIAAFDTKARVKIVALADSMGAWKMGTKSNMFDHAQKYFNKKEYAILNLSIPGTDADEYITRYKKYVTFNSDCIIMCLYLGNDVRIYSKTNRGGMVDSNYLHEPKWKSFFRHSVLLNLAFRYLKYKIGIMRSGFFENNIKVMQKNNKLTDAYIQNRIKLINNDILEKARSDAINPWVVAGGISNPSFYKDLFGMRSAYAYIAANSTLGIISEFYTGVLKNCPHFFIVLLPESLQVSPEYDNFYKKCGFYLDNFPIEERRKLNEYLKAGLDKLKIKVVDATYELEKEKKDRVYVDYDTHLNSLGNKIVGNMIVSIIKTSFENESEIFVDKKLH